MAITGRDVEEDPVCWSVGQSPSTSLVDIRRRFDVMIRRFRSPLTLVITRIEEERRPMTGSIQAKGASTRSDHMCIKYPRVCTFCRTFVSLSRWPKVPMGHGFCI